MVVYWAIYGWTGAYLGEEVVDGLALAVSVPPENRLTPCLLSIEWSARMPRVGVWSLGHLPRESKNLIKWLSSSYWRGGTDILDQTTMILDGKLRVVLPGIDPSVIMGARYEVRGWVSRSPKALRADWPWTLKLKDFSNRVRVY